MVEFYDNYTRSDDKVQKIPSAPGATLSKSDLEEPYHIAKYISFVGQILWYTTKVASDVSNASRELALHVIHPGLEHYKALVHLIGCLKGKDTKGIIIRNPNVLKDVMFCGYNYVTDKDTRNSVSGLVPTLGGTILKNLLKTQRTVAVSITEGKYVALSACSQGLKFISMLLEKLLKCRSLQLYTRIIK